VADRGGKSGHGSPSSLTVEFGSHPLMMNWPWKTGECTKCVPSLSLTVTCMVPLTERGTPERVKS